MEFKLSKIERSLNRFNAVAEDLSRADFNTYADRFGAFLHYCESDSVFQEFHKSLRGLASPCFKKWYAGLINSGGAMAGQIQLVFPGEPEMRLAMMYEFIIRIAEDEIDLLGQAPSWFAISGSKYDYYIDAFSEAVTVPMIREMNFKFEDLIDDLEDEYESDDKIPSTSLTLINNSGTLIQQTATGSNISQRATHNQNSDLSNKFQELRDHPDATADDIDLINKAEEEAKQEKPSKPVVNVLLNGLSFASSATGIAASIMSMMGS